MDTKTERRVNLKTRTDSYLAKKLSRRRLRQYQAQQMIEQGVVDRINEHITERCF